ncbi:alpha/beta hydrolase [Rhodobacteraceae bacterium]|nr:alpha/beta hydrolase [Paracoccaceae bacterium]
MTVYYVIAALLLVLAALPVLAEAQRRAMTPSRQQKAPGQIAQLSQGATHYRWYGPEDGDVAICIHGLSTPSFIFAATERSLANFGYRVLSYDLYGRGYSERVAGDQTDAFFLTQLRDLMADQKITGNVTILGFSMGAQIATAFAAEEGPMIDALILAAPAGLSPATLGTRSGLWQAPIIGDWLTRVFGGWVLRRELTEHRSIATVIPDLEDRQAAETHMRGFLPAVLSSRRHLMSQPLIDNLKRCQNHGTPLLALWGKDDPIVPLSAMGTLTRYAPDAQHGQIAGAGHNLLQTHPSQIAAHLGHFLNTDI